MPEVVKVALDAMGGDYAPVETVHGAVLAAQQKEDIEVILVGQEDVIRNELAKYTYPAERISVVHASETIEMAEQPTNAIRTKQDSSIVVAMKLVKEGKAHGFVSAGNSGAVLVGGGVLVGKQPGIRRAPFAPVIPTANGASLLIDCGANVDAKAADLLLFAKIGSSYMEHVMGVKNPTVGLVNIGAEEEKGNALVKEAMPLLKSCSELNFIGSVEAREIPNGAADVIVCDAFVGNVILKLYEGVADTMMRVIKKGMLSSLRSKIGALLVKPALKETLKAYDANNYGGAPMLGLKGLVVKVHGNAKAPIIANSILQCVTFQQQGMNEKIQKKITDTSDREGKE